MGRNLWIKQLRKEDGDLLDEDDVDPLTKRENSENKENRAPEPRVINIGGKATVFMGKGDRLVIETPGGGAWGAEDATGADGGHVGVLEKVKGVAEWAARGSLAERAAQQAGFGGF